MPSWRTIKYGFFQPLILLNGGYFAGSATGMDSRPVGCRAFAAWVSAGEVCGGLEQATRAPSRIKRATVCTAVRTIARNVVRDIVRTTFSPSAIIAARRACGGVPFQ